MDHLRVEPGKRVHLNRLDPSDTGKHKDEEAARARLLRVVGKLAALQDVLYAEHKRAVLIILQGMDTAGKDGTIKHVMSAVNSNGCEVAPFKVPTDEEAAHDFLWRAHRWAPRAGHIAIFNRSHYEDVLVPRVHCTLPRDAVKRRYAQINAFEKLLVENGTVVLKFFLHISKQEQRQRLIERRDDPTKQWKFSLGDLEERKLWSDYMDAYEELLSRCSTKEAPWYIVPSDHKWYRNLVVAEVLVEALRELGCEYPAPPLPPARLRRIRI